MPTMNIAGAVAAFGMATKSGAKKSASKKHRAVTIAVSPLLPPAFTPAALSMNVETVVVPSMAPAVVPMESAMKALFMPGISPFSLTRPTRCPTPMSVPIVSKISMKRSVATHTAMSMLMMFSHCIFMKMGSMPGGTFKRRSKCVSPSGIPAAAVARIPISKAPGTLRTSSMTVKRMPAAARSTEGLCRLPSVTIVSSLPSIIPALCSPINAMKSPMPGEMALRSSCGMASTILSLSPVIVSRINIMPSTNTAVRPNCHV